MISSRCEYEDHGYCQVKFGIHLCTCPCHNKRRQECVKVTVTFEDAAGNKVHIETDQFEYAEYGVEDITPAPTFSEMYNFYRTTRQPLFALTTLVHNVTNYKIRYDPVTPAIDEGDILDEPE